MVSASSWLKFLTPIHQLLWWLGHEIRPVFDHRWHRDHLERLGFHPHTIVDVGVAFGTPDLYQVFPDAYYVLVEPAREFEPHLKRILKHYTGQYVLSGLGARDEQRVLNVEGIHRDRHSMYRRTALEVTGHELIQQEVPVTTLDHLLTQHDFQPPFGLKIDTEGCEYEIIQGAQQFLTQTEFVIAEVAVANRFHDAYSFLDFINLMHEHQFELCEILSGGRSDNQTLIYIDAVFRRTSS